ncbi:MAG: aspartate aminotransferase family protein [Spirochaetia bacterium]|nr:aspartate aminotransferase family protein [Spirochaetia bacterium]
MSDTENFSDNDESKNDINTEEEDAILFSRNIQIELEKEKSQNPYSAISYEPENLMKFEDIKKLDEKYILNTYARMPVAFAYGSGEFLYDEKGHEYIDFLSGIAVTAMGHAHADLIAALERQADLLWHTSNLFYNQQQALLARALIEISFPGKVFFCNSGTEANEAALKLMLAYGQKYGKEKIIALRNGFHGRTFGAMSLTGQKKIQDGFGPLLDNISYIDPNDIHALDQEFSEDVAGIIMEPILGEGGVYPLTSEFITRARDLCDQNDSLLVLDEVQTGMGRTGNYFAYQEFEIIPDVMTLAKGLGGGFPIGAMIVADRFADVFQSGMHGSTFGGNHLATAVGYEVIRLIEVNKVLENVNNMSAYLAGYLENLRSAYPDKIAQIRGKGLLQGIVLHEGRAARPIVQKALEKHLVIGRSSENVLRLAPPLIVRPRTIDRAMEKLEEVIKEL